MHTFGIYLTLHLIGVGFLGVLLWAGLGSTLVAAQPASRLRRYRRIAGGLVAGGIVHPVLAFAGRDLLREQAICAGEAPTPSRAADVAAGLSTVGWGLVVALSVT